MANNRELSQLGSIVVVDDSSKNLGIGTTNPNAIVGAGNTAKLSVGILSAYQLFGDGSALTNLPAAGFQPDAQENLYAGTSAGAASDADTCFNIGIGYSAGASLNSGDNNIFLGCCAGNSTDSGYSNVFLGTKAGGKHTSGNYNVAIGQCANASGTTTGQHNVFVGCGAGDCVTSGCDNVYLGRGAGNDVTTARCNIALGFYAGSSNLAGIHNIFFGNNAGGSSSSGNNNINIGQRSGFCNAGGCYNNFIGSYAGFHNTTGSNNNYFGYAAGYCNCTGSANNFFGENAGFDFASGSNNVFIGYYSGKLQTSGDCNIAIGHNACLPNKTGSSQLAIGAGNTNWIAGDSSFNVTIAGIATVTASTGVVEATKFCGDGSCLTNLPAAGFLADAQENLYAGTSAGASSDADTCFNIGIGYSAGSALNAGDNNILLGCEVGRSLTNGCHNIFLGLAAAKSTTSGTHNIVMGYLAGCSTSSLGSGNVILGSSAAKSMTGNCNIAIGCDANWFGCGGGCNIILGKAAGYKNCGNYNVFLGRYTGGYNRTGAYNVFLGCGTGSTNTTGCSNIAIGCQVSLPSATGDNQLAIGNGSNRWITGDSSFNVTIANKLLVYTSGIVTASSGIVTYYGDGSNLTGISGGISNVVEDTTPQLGGDLDLNGNDITGTGNFNITGVITATSYDIELNDLSDVTTKPTSVLIGTGVSTNNTENTVIGQQAGANIGSVYGRKNTFVGYQAGKFVGNEENVAIGNQALGGATGSVQSSVARNIAIGDRALRNIQGYSINNTVVGTWAGYELRTATSNTLLGYSAGYGLTTGSSNTLLGWSAGDSITSGDNNIVIGKGADASSATTDNEITLGNSSITKFRIPGIGLTFSSTGANIAGVITATSFSGNGASLTNVNADTLDTLDSTQFLRSDAADTKTSGDLSFSDAVEAKFGDHSDLRIYHNSHSYIIHGGASATGNLHIRNTVADQDIIMMADDGSGSFTTYLQAEGASGELSLHHYGAKKLATKSTGVTVTGSMCATTLYGDGSNLTGIDAGFSPDAQENLYAGTNAGAASDADTCFNVGIGYCALESVNSGDSNVAIGKMAARNATGFQNVVLGDRAGRDLTGFSNVIIGQLTGVYSTGANCNVFLGAYSAQCTSGNDNVILGSQAGRYATTGCYNVFFGKCTSAGGPSNNVTGNHNIVMGCEAGLCLTSGANNIFLGQEAGKKIVDGVDNVALGQHAGCALTSGCGNVFLGSNAGCTNTSGDSNIAIGCQVSLPSATGDNQLAIGNGSNRWIIGDSSYNVCLAGSTIKAMASGGIFHATKFCGDGSCLTGISAAGTGAIGGLTVKDEGTVVGTAGSISTFDFVGSSVVVTATSGASGVATVTISGGFQPDAQENLYAGTNAGAASDTDTCFNVGIGYCALKSVNSGDSNVAIGCDAGRSITSANANVFIGRNTGVCNVSGYGNVAIGDYAGWKTEGGQNVFIGANSGALNTTGDDNIHIGYNAGCESTTASCNIFLGRQVGKCAGTAANHNTFLGNYTGYCITGTDNIFVGNRAGFDALAANHNIFLGKCSGANDTTGSDNIFLGQRSGQGVTTGCYNIYFGKCTAAGGTATGNCNIAMGRCAGYSLTSGYDNVMFGYDAGYNSVDAAHNVFIGKQAGCTNTSGGSNVAIGCQVSLPSATGSCQLAIGVGTDRWITGTSDFNVGIGLTNPQSKLEVNVGTAVSAFDIQGSAGQLFSVTNNLTSGSIFSVNDVSGIPSIDVDADGTIQLAPFSTTEFVGVGTTNPTTKLHVVGDTFVTGVVTATDFNSTSDARLKTNVQVIDDPLEKVLQINGVSFNWIENDKPSMGVIADNIEEVVPELVSDTDPKTVNYNGLIGLLIEVVKEQQTQIDSLNERLSRLE